MSIISVENVLVEKDVTTACFSCNLGLCHGACCVEGELGAPLKTEEVAALEDGVELLLDRLPEKTCDIYGVTAPSRFIRGISIPERSMAASAFLPSRKAKLPCAPSKRLCSMG